jgi:hypothetical protein
MRPFPSLPSRFQPLFERNLPLRIGTCQMAAIAWNFLKHALFATINARLPMMFKTPAVWFGAWAGLWPNPIRLPANFSGT